MKLPHLLKSCPAREAEAGVEASPVAPARGAPGDSGRGRLAREALGTFWIVFAGTGTVVLCGMAGPGGWRAHVLVALAFGGAVWSAMAFFRKAGGGHFNPAVSAVLAAFGRFPVPLALKCGLAQLAGAGAASAAVKWIFPSADGWGATVPTVQVLAAVALETMLTALLMLTILGTAGNRQAPLLVGAVVGLEAFAAGTLTGASMNPARSTGPALISGSLDFLWIYWIGPMAGAWLGMAVCRLSRGRDCCPLFRPV